jgi:hypothetical protein
LPQAVPNLSLTQGQLLWALSHGRDPDQLLKDQVRYLRQLGIPKKSTEVAPGKGNRIRYDFFDLVELGVAFRALMLRFRPKDIAALLVSDREAFRQIIAQAWLELPDAALTQDWVKSRGRTTPLIAAEINVRLHGRRSEKWGQLDIVGFNDSVPGLSLFAPIERFDDGDVLPLVPLKHSMLPWVAWALEAPVIRTGPKK